MRCGNPGLTNFWGLRRFTMHTLCIPERGLQLYCRWQVLSVCIVETGLYAKRRQPLQSFSDWMCLREREVFMVFRVLFHQLHGQCMC